MVKERHIVEKRLINLLFAAALLLAVIPQAVGAESGMNTQSETNTSFTPEQIEKLETQRQEVQKRALEQAKEKTKQLEERRKEAEQQREKLMQKEKERVEALSAKMKEELQKKKAAFQKLCETRKAAFKMRIEGLTVALQKQVASLDGIEAKVEAYVQTSHLAIANYESLLTAVKEQRQLLTNLQPTGTQTASSFGCAGEKAEVQNNLSAYKDVAKQQLDAVKNYKIALKDLIKAVKSAAQAHEKAS